MILTKITLTIEDREFDIRHFNYHFCRDTDSKGRPSSRYYGGMLLIEMESLPENYLLSRLLIFEQMQVSGKIEIWANDGEQCIRRIEFEKAYICHHIEEMDTNQALPMLTTISISPLRLDINKKVRIDRRWPETQGFWTKYEPPKEEKKSQDKEVIYVKKVEGKSQVGVGDKVKYRVTQYTQEGITEDEKKDIKWVVSVEGKRTNLSDKGEVITLTIKPEWAGKEIIVMPYLHSSTEKVSVKTKVALKDGVFLWVETQSYGHTFVSVTINNQTHVFTYGRYDVEYKITKKLPIEEGVLIIYKDEVATRYITEELYKVTPQVYEIKDVDPYEVRNKFGMLWVASKEKPDDIDNEDIKKYGKVIDTYVLWSNNCTTKSIKILKECGTQVFIEDFIKPSSLKVYLNNSKNPNIADVTEKMKNLYIKKPL